MKSASNTLLAMSEEEERKEKRMEKVNNGGIQRDKAWQMRSVYVCVYVNVCVGGCSFVPCTSVNH